MKLTVCILFLTLHSTSAIFEKMLSIFDGIQEFYPPNAESGESRVTQPQSYGRASQGYGTNYGYTTEQPDRTYERAPSSRYATGSPSRSFEYAPNQATQQSAWDHGNSSGYPRNPQQRNYGSNTRYDQNWRSDDTSSHTTTHSHSSTFNEFSVNDNERGEYKPLPVYEQYNRPEKTFRLFWTHERVKSCNISYYCPRREAAHTIIKQMENNLKGVPYEDNYAMQNIYSLVKVKNGESMCNAPVILLRERKWSSLSSYGFYIYTDEAFACREYKEPEFVLDWTMEHFQQMQDRLSENHYFPHRSVKKSKYASKICFIELFKSFFEGTYARTPEYYEYIINATSFTKVKSTYPNGYSTSIQVQDDKSPFLGCRNAQTEDAYDMENQRKEFVKQMYESNWPGTYIPNKMKEETWNYLMKEQLIRKVLFAPLVPYFFFEGHNSVYGNCSFLPVWDEIYRNYYIPIEKAIYNLAAQVGGNVRIFKGRSSTSLVHRRKKMLYLKQTTQITIGEFIWTLLIDYIGKRAVFVAIMNNPFHKQKHTPIPDYKHACTKQCADLGLNIPSNMKYSALIACCHPQDKNEISKYVQLPELVTLGLYHLKYNSFYVVGH